MSQAAESETEFERELGGSSAALTCREEYSLTPCPSKVKGGWAETGSGRSRRKDMGGGERFGSKKGT